MQASLREHEEWKRKNGGGGAGRAGPGGPASALRSESADDDDLAEALRLSARLDRRHQEEIALAGGAAAAALGHGDGPRSVVVPVGKELVGMIVGKKRANVNILRRETGCEM